MEAKPIEFLDNSVRQNFFTFKELFEWYEEDKLVIGPDMLPYEPESFILYCLSNIRLPHFYFDGGQFPYLTLDGNKRLRTIINFRNNEFPLANGQYHDEIRGYLRHRLEWYDIPALVINPSNESKMDLIRLITQ